MNAFLKNKTFLPRVADSGHFCLKARRRGAVDLVDNMAQREKSLFKDNWLDALMESRNQDPGELLPRQLEETRQRKDEITKFAEAYLTRTMHDVVKEMERENKERQEARKVKAARSTTVETRTMNCQQLLLVAAKHEQEDRERWMTESADKNINTV